MWHLVTPKQRSLHHIILLYRSCTTDFSLATRDCSAISATKRVNLPQMWLLRLHCEYEEQRYNQHRWWIYVQGWPPVQQRQSMLRIIGTFLSSRGGAGLAKWDHAHSIFMFRNQTPFGRKSLRYHFATLPGRSRAKHLQMSVRILGSSRVQIWHLLILCSQSARQWSFVFEKKCLNISTYRTKPA